MPPKKAISTKRTRNKADYRREGLERLRQHFQEDSEEEFDPSGEPRVTPLLVAAEGGIKAVMDALRVHDEEDARTFIELYDSLSARDRSYLTLEEISYASGIGSLRLAEVAVSGLIKYGEAQAKMVLATSMRKVTKSIVKAATDEIPITAYDAGLGVMKVVGKTNGDTRAMELFGKMTGLIPAPKGAQVFIQNNVAPEKQEPEPGKHAWLDAGDRLRQIHDAVDPKRLPAPAAEPISIGSRLDHLQAETAEILVERDV